MRSKSTLIASSPRTATAVVVVAVVAHTLVTAAATVAKVVATVVAKVVFVVVAAHGCFYMPESKRERGEMEGKN